jgi:hypothetical protein
MSTFEILLCLNLTVSVYAVWQIKTLGNDLDELGVFSVSNIIKIMKKLEMKVETDIDTSD